MPLPKVLAQIRPEYPHLVHYSKPSDPLQGQIPEQPPEIGPKLPDTPTRTVNIKADVRFARRLRKAAETCPVFD